MRVAILLAAACAAAPVLAGSCRVAGGERVTPVVELYTSEGCSSCPPADRWLSDRFPPGAGGGTIVLAFHVDYWDRLGWKDRFATPTATARQRQAARANAATFVYTPQVLLHGRDFAGWRHGALAEALAKVAARPAEAGLAVDVKPGAAGLDVEARVTLPDAATGATLVVALVDSGHATAVNAGENRGATLRHDHVVRAFDSRAVAARDTTARIRLPHPSPAGAHGQLIAFVQEPQRGDILQAVALPLAVCK